MLKMYREFRGKTVTNKEDGDVNRFLKNLLVEVVTENYRQSIFEALEMDGDSEPSHLDPPLRANERVISGLFASAMARVAPRSRTEVRIDRPDWDSNQNVEMPSEENEVTNTLKAGRVDYLAWYDDRVFAVELKAASMNCEDPQLTASVAYRWERAVEQAHQVQNHLRRLNKEDSNRYPRPISLALMVVIGRRRVKDSVAMNEKAGEMAERFIKMLKTLEPKRPSFQAIYTFPEDFRDMAPRKKGRVSATSETIVYTPFVAFLARAAVNTTS